MSALRGWGLPEQHLATEALVAFVDGELSGTARDRAASHLAHCANCAAEAGTQRQARSAIQSAATPSAPSGLMSALQSIPQDAPLPRDPDELVISEDGGLVAATRTAGSRTPAGKQSAAFGSGAALGSREPLGTSVEPLGTSVEPLGTSVAPLGTSVSLGSTASLGRPAPPAGSADEHQHAAERGATRRGWHGASVVVTGLVLGALALINPGAENEVQKPVYSQPEPDSASSPRAVQVSPANTRPPTRRAPVMPAPVAPGAPTATDDDQPGGPSPLTPGNSPLTPGNPPIGDGAPTAGLAPLR